MGSKVYLDSNVWLDLVEGSPTDIFPNLQALVDLGRIDVVASELNLIEILAGGNRPEASAVLRRLFAVTSSWLYLSGLATREVVFAFDNPRRARSLLPVAKLYAWSEILPLITTDSDREQVSELAEPTMEALRTAFPADDIREHQEHWKHELSSQNTALRDELKYIGTVQNFFRKTVASALRVNLGDSRELADRLWDDPDLAPAFRLEIELGAHVLNVPTPRWRHNDLLDHAHAGVLGYVDYFITRDGAGKKRGLIQKLHWYDQTVRVPRARLPYGHKLCASWSDLEQRIVKDTDPC